MTNPSPVAPLQEREKVEQVEARLRRRVQDAEEQLSDQMEAFLAGKTCESCRWYQPRFHGLDHTCLAGLSVPSPDRLPTCRLWHSK